MQEFLLTGLLGAGLIVLCGLITYEALRFLWSRLPGLTMPPRQRVFFVVACVFASHIVNIWLFGVTYYVLMKAQLGTMIGTAIERGEYALDLFGCLYFSATTYSTVSFGDITPEGALRMIAGVEGLAGFILIGWTVSFTYLVMEKFWQLPHRKK